MRTNRCSSERVALARYKRASEDARSLPPNLLTNSQRLKLYALFKQAEGPAPESGPSRFDAVARAKWEAWNDVRSLSAEQAVESYCSIIEGLVAITGGAAAALSPANGHAGAAAGESGSGAPEEAVVTVVGEAVVAEAAPADSAGEAVAKRRASLWGAARNDAFYAACVPGAHTVPDRPRHARPVPPDSSAPYAPPARAPRAQTRSSG